MVYAHSVKHININHYITCINSNNNYISVDGNIDVITYKIILSSRSCEVTLATNTSNLPMHYLVLCNNQTNRDN